MTRDEYIKRRNKREGETSSLSSSKNAYERYAERKTSGIFENAYTKGAEALNNIYSGWNSTEDFARNQQIALESQKAMEEAQNLYGISRYDDVLKAYNQNLEGISSAGETYSKYVNADAYNKAVKKYQLGEKYKGASYEDIQNALKSASDIDEISFLRNYTDYSSLEDFDKAIADRESKRAEVEKGRKGKVTDVTQEKLKTAKSRLEAAQRYDKYAPLAEAADFAQYSDPTQILKAENGQDTDYYKQNKALFDRSITSGSFNAVRLNEMNEDMQRMGAYLLNSPQYGEEAYLQYMRDMSDYVRNEQAEENAQMWSGYAEEHPVLATIGSAALQPTVGGLAGIEQLLDIANGHESVSYLTGMSSAMASANSQISQKIKDEHGYLPSFAYDVFATGVPNRLGQMLFGSGYNIVMGLQSFADTYADEINKGTASGTALLNALVAGGIETLTEQVGMEWAFGESEGAIETLLKQAFAEGSEEIVGSLANTIYDINVNGGQAEYYQNMQNYIAMGYSSAEAKQKATLDYIKDVAHQFAVAAFSTMPTGGVQQARRVYNESKMGEYIDREKLGEINSEKLLKKYGEEWTQKASNREVYNAYDKYVTETKTKATEAEKADSVKALMSEYNLSEEEASKYVEALYEGTNQKILKTHFGSVIKEEADNGTGWAAKGDFSESSKYVDELSKSADMIMSEDQVKANKAQKNLKVGEKNTVNGEEAEIISMKANKDGSYTVKTSKGEVDSKEITVTENKAKALSYSADIQNETLKEAFVHYYQGEDIYDYDQYVRTAYEAGIESLDLSEFTSVIDGLGKAKAMAFYNLGAEKTLREELATEEALDKVTKAIKTTGKFVSGAFVDGKFKEDKDIFRNLNRTQKKLYKVVEAFSKLSGINTRIFVDRSAASKNGEFVSGSDGGWISINLAARPYGDSMYGINKYVVSTLSHELTHWMKANNEEAYNILESAIVESLTEKGTLENAIKREQDSYKKTEGKELSREVALEEVVARACEDMINNTETMSEVLSHTDMNGLERLKAAFEEWFKHIKEFFDELMSGFSSPNEITQSLTEEYEELRKIWVKGINDAINMKRSGQQSSEKKVASVKASIKITTDNKQAVAISDDILANVSEDKWVETVKNALFTHDITVPHDVIKVNRVTRKEYTYSEYTKYLKRKEGTKYYDKLRAAKYVDEMVEASFNYVNEESKHNNFDTFSRGNVLLDIGGNQYSAEVVIGITQKKEMVFYDIVNIVPTSFQYKRTITSDESQRDVSQKGYRSLENNITQTDSNVKNSVKLSEREEKALDTLNVEVEGSYAYPKFNLKTFKESDYNKNIDVAAAALAKTMEISVEEAKKYIKDVGSIANIIAKDRERLDYIAIEGKSAWVSNPEYGGSLDYSFLCPKRLTYTGTMNAILKKQNDLIFSVDDFLWLRKALITAGYEAPCSYCFVESARARFGKYNKQFLDIAKAENLSYIPTAEDLTNPDKLEEMREKHPETYRRYEKFLNSLSQRKPKMLEERRAYDGDILKAFMGKEDTIKDKNLHGGIRFNSFSDFEIVHMLDCMQAIMDMSRVGLAGFGYTKQKAFVEIFGKTGLKINMSCMAKGVEADGKHIIFDDIEGMNHNDALKLRSGNVGIVCVVFNDVQLRAALCDERIDYVLPFHRSQWSKADYEKMGLSLDTKDYTRPQTEKLGTKKAKEGNIPFLSYWNANQTGTETVQRYLDIINEQGKTPIFPVVLEKVDGKWVMPKGIKKNGKFINKTEEIKEKAAENYWKLLTEAKMYNNDGTPIGQTAVTPNFNMKAARELLKKYDGSHKEFPVAQNVVDDFLEYKKTGETKNFEWKRNSNKQTISSENTSLNQTPATFTNYEFKSTDRILDWGGGRYDTSKKALEATYPGIKVEVVDPFNRTESHNSRVLKEYSSNKANVLTVNNVLNVINSSSAIEDVIKESKNYLSKDGIAYFAIYEGDGSGVGKETSAGYQNNQKASYYVPFVEKYYKNVDKKGSFIIASDSDTKTTKISTDTKARLAQNTAEFKKQNLLMKDSKYSNKMDSKGNVLTENQAEYFKDSKIRDSKGNLLLVRHGTDNKFTVFNPKELGGQHGNAEGYGIYFSDDTEVTSKYGDIQLEGYLNITKPAYSDKRTITETQLVRFIRATINYEVDKWGSSPEDTWISNYANTYQMSLNDAMFKVAKDILRMNSNDKDIIQEIMIGMGIRSYKEAYEFYDVLTDTLGFDGIVVKWKHDDGESNVFVAFNSNQFKNADNLSPTNSEDIRYSGKMDSEGKELTVDQAKFFEKSKARDKDGNLMTMYHGSRGAGFTVFNPRYSDDHRSLFFTNDYEVAKSYNSSKEMFEPDKPMTFEELDKAIQYRTGEDKYLKKDGNDVVLMELGYIQDPEDREVFRGTLKEVQKYFIDSYKDVFDATYKTYLNLKNPLIMDADGNYWNELPLPGDYDQSFSNVDIYKHSGEDIYEADWTENGEEKHGEFANRAALEEKFGRIWEEFEYNTVHIDDIYLGFDGSRLPTNTRSYAEYAQNHGYDGVIFYNIIDNGVYGAKFKKSTVMIAFDANQVKSVYNEHPTKNDDYRYSNKMDSRGSSLTEAQAKYFKDSKVRDKDGNLLVMYHGTNEEFNEFKPNEFIKEINGTSKIVGYFSEDKEYAESYGDVSEYYLNITNPLVMSGEAMTLSGWKKFFREKGINNVIFDSALTGKKGQKSTLIGGTFDGETYYFFYELLDMSDYWYGDGNLTEKIQEAGYDGIKTNDDIEKAWMPFNANAVKRTDNLNPTTDKDIRKSEKMSYDELSDSAKERIRELEEQVGKLSDENAALRAEKLMEKNKAEKKIMVDRITEQAKVLSRWLLTDDKHNPVPQPIRIPLGKFLTSIDYTKDSYEWRKSHGLLTKSDETLGTRMAKISQMLLELDQDKAVDKDAYDMSQLDWIPEFSNEFAKIKDTIAEVESKEGERFHLGKMNHDDLQTLLNLITALKTSIINMNKCLSAHNKMSVDAVGKNVISYLDRIGQKDKDGGIRQWLEVSNTTPYYFFQRLGEGGEQTFRLLMDGMSKYAYEAKQIEDYAKETFKGEDVKKWRDEVKTFEVEEYEIKTDKKEGEMPLERKLRTIQMTVPQIMSLYCLQKRDQAMNHIKTGGIKVGTFETRENDKKVKVRQIDNVTLTEKDLKKILAVLTDEQKEVADKLQNFMNTVCQKWGNEVTMKRFGYKGMTEKNYFPISVDRNQLSSEARQKGSSLYQMLNMGFTKPINPNAKNPIEIFDIFETFTIHATEMAQYNSLALPVLDVIKIWNYRDQELLDEEENKARWHSVKGSIESVLGEKANGYIGRLLADLNGDVTGGRADKSVKKLVKNYKTAAVAANLQVAMLQPISYIRAGYMIDEKYLTKALTMKSDREKCLQYCGIAQWKEMGFYNTAINTGLEHKIMQDDSKKDKLIEKTLFLAGKMDEWTWGKLWNACLLETKDNYPTLEGEDLYKKTGERLTEVIYGTQVVDSILTRSDLMRGADMYTNMITAFQSEPTLSLNILMDAAVRFDQEKRANGAQAALKVHGDKIKRAAMVYLTSAAVESLLRAVIGKIRNYDGDEDDETLIEDFFKRFIEELNPLRKIPIVKDFVDILVSAVSKGKIYTDARLDEAIFENIGKSYLRIKKLLSGGEVNYRAINEIAKGFDASGLPVSSSLRVLKVLWNNTIGRVWESLNIK